jgi:hypothetical protein
LLRVLNPSAGADSSADPSPVDNFGENEANNWVKVNGNGVHDARFAVESMIFLFLINGLWNEARS